MKNRLNRIANEIDPLDVLIVIGLLVLDAGIYGLSPAWSLIFFGIEMIAIAILKIIGTL